MTSVSGKKIKGADSSKKEDDTLVRMKSISHDLRKYWQSRFIFHPHQVVTKIIEDDGIKLLKHEQYYLHSIKYLKPKTIKDEDGRKRTVKTSGALRHIPVNATFIDYTFMLSRVANRFLWYLLTYEVDYLTNQFKFDKKVKHEWMVYCVKREQTGEEAVYSGRTMQNVMTELRENNVVINISKSIYMVNPIMVCKGGTDDQNRMVNQYAEAIIKKGKEVSLFLMPTL